MGGGRGAAVVVGQDERRVEVEAGVLRAAQGGERAHLAVPISVALAEDGKQLIP